MEGAGGGEVGVGGGRGGKADEPTEQVIIAEEKDKCVCKTELQQPNYKKCREKRQVWRLHAPERRKGCELSDAIHFQLVLIQSRVHICIPSHQELLIHGALFLVSTPVSDGLLQWNHGSLHNRKQNEAQSARAESTHNLRSKDVTRTQQQRPESTTVTLT